MNWRGVGAALAAQAGPASRGASASTSCCQKAVSCNGELKLVCWDVVALAGRIQAGPACVQPHRNFTRVSKHLMLVCHCCTFCGACSAQRLAQIPPPSRLTLPALADPLFRLGMLLR